MTEELTKDDAVPLRCRHCSSVTLEVTVRAGGWIKQCPTCKRHTAVRIENRGGRWEIYTGPLPKCAI